MADKVVTHLPEIGDIHLNSTSYFSRGGGETGRPDSEKSGISNKLDLKLTNTGLYCSTSGDCDIGGGLNRTSHLSCTTASGDGSDVGGCIGTENEKSEVRKKLLHSNVETDKAVDHLDSCSKRSSTSSRMAYHEHTMESMRADSPLSASMSLLSTDTSSLHNNSDDSDSPRHHAIQIHMAQVNPDLEAEEDYCSDSSQNEMTPDNRSICSSGSISTIGSMSNDIAETQFSIFPPRGTTRPTSTLRDKKSQPQDISSKHH